MFLSKMILNQSQKEVRRDLASTYNMHRTIYNIFPDQGKGGNSRILYRLEAKKDRPDESFILLLSEKEPNFNLLSQNYLKEFFSQTVDFQETSINENSLFYFRLRANPTVKRNGKRLGLFEYEDQKEWFIRKSKNNGFDILSQSIINEGVIRVEKNGVTMKLISSLFEGILKVTDKEKFIDCLSNGVGSAKGFGFGLLTIARYHYG